MDAAIVDGIAHLNAMCVELLAAGLAHERRAANLLDGGAPFYDLYETADGRHLAIGALEPQFYDRPGRRARHPGPRARPRRPRQLAAPCAS